MQLQLPFVHFQPLTPELRFREYLLIQYGVAWEKVVGPSHQPRLAEVRFLYGLFMSRHFGHTREAIGRDIRRNHSTVTHGIQEINNRLTSKDPGYDTLRHVYTKLDTFLTKQTTNQHHDYSQLRATTPTIQRGQPTLSIR